MGRNEMIGWVVGLFVGLALITAGVVCIVEIVVLRSDADGLSREQGSD
jgi:hypothetical protein